MNKRVLSVGQCAYDEGSIRALLERQFSAKVVTASGAADALAALRGQSFDLVLINREFDRDGGEGLELLKQIKADAELSATPCMLVTNYPEFQAAAIAAGAEPGFGKRDYTTPETRARLAQVLE